MITAAKSTSDQYGFYGRLSSKFPSQVIVDVTEICNLSCTHCPHPDFRKSEHYGARMLDIALNQKLIDEVRAHGADATQYVRYTSNGEPLVHPKIMEMLKYAKDHSGTTVTLTTNGKIMREAQTEKLLDVGVDLIDISIDALSPEVYAKIRVGGDLNVTGSNVRRLLKRKQDTGSHMKVVVSYIEQPENLHETKDFEKYWKDQGADYVVVRRLHSASGSKGAIAQDMWSKIDPKKRKPCVYPWERIVLNAKAQLAFCPADWSHGSSFIDYNQTTILETWNGDFYRELREAHLKNNYSCHKFCGQCPDWSVIRWPDEGRAYADMVSELSRDGGQVTEKAV